MCIGLADAKENIRIGITDANNFLFTTTKYDFSKKNTVRDFT
jgi:hypothetical protein